MDFTGSKAGSSPVNFVMSGRSCILPEPQSSHLYHVNTLLQVAITLLLAKCLLINSFLTNVNFLTLFPIEHVELNILFQLAS